MRTFKVEFWNSEYKGAPSKLLRIEEWEDCEESFIKFYNLNNQLKYCNGTHYSFVDKEVRERYSVFHKEYNTISNYYGNGVVD
jgi:hypothetical protein